MSELTDNPTIEDEREELAPEEDASERDLGAGEEDWEELADGELPPRPRGRWRRPLPIALVALLIASLGFLAGVLVQKGAGEGGGGVPGGGMPGFAAAGGSGGESGEAGESGSAMAAGGGMPSFGGTEAAATGTVSSVDGKTIYVQESDGTIVAVKAEDGTTVTRDANVAAKAIRPGDTVVVEGSKNGSTVKASSISATEDGVEGGAAGFASPGGEGGGGEGASVDSLFE